MTGFNLSTISACYIMRYKRHFIQVTSLYRDTCGCACFAHRRSLTRYPPCLCSSCWAELHGLQRNQTCLGLRNDSGFSPSNWTGRGPRSYLFYPALNMRRPRRHRRSAKPVPRWRASNGGESRCWRRLQWCARTCWVIHLFTLATSIVPLSVIIYVHGVLMKKSVEPLTELDQTSDPSSAAALRSSFPRRFR